jgi:protein TonB
MTGAAPASVPYPHVRSALTRLGSALAVSAAFHALMAWVLAPALPPQNSAATPASAITARIEPSSALITETGSVSDRSMQFERRQSGHRARATDNRIDPVQSEVHSVTPSIPLPPISDATIYGARDLDSYPRPIAPLDMARLEANLDGHPIVIRLETTIDERGIVKEAVVVGPGVTSRMESEIRAMLAATPFIAARKDGRAVKSRVLLSVSLTAKRDSHRQD